ncbi:hypothetical protein RhiirC2_711936 [Rhizophagus irregularis]|uniref:FAR1 domain-containing protein n=1 Tax=Rhizophagus irregularis TaxID=588596 RepID=A0A2N1N957_9GLOM|nr:hypothetical protein RhiirC2_711936 [Rhizophagus irregularis]
MDKNAHKRSLVFEIYSSKEEIIDVDRLQEDYKSESTLLSLSFEDSIKKCAIFDLEEGDTFENWDLAERQVENYLKEVGFEIVRRRINKNRYGEIKRRTFECQNSRKYCAKKRADIEETRERERVKISCPWKVNLSYNKGVIRVTSICKEHNHPLFGNRNIASNCRLSPKMLEEIEFLVNVGCEADLIIRMLQKQFPDAVIHPKNVYNAICLFRRDQKVMKTDAAETYDKLIKMQCEEHGWFVEVRLEGDDNHLTAVVSDETKETYQWILECLLHATNGLAPRVLFTDADADIQIQLQLDKEEKFERLEEQVNQNPTVGLPNVIKRYFKRIDSIIKKYLIPQVLKIQRRQMNESLLYRVKKIENWEHLLERSDEKDSKVKFAEDDYESKLSNLCFLFSYLDHAVIHEVWSVMTIEQNKEHFVVLYGNTNYLCTCMWLVTRELSWIRKKEIEIRDRQLERIIGSKENLPNISNPHQTRTKGAPKKRVKNALENTTIKYSNNKNRQDIKKLNDKHHEKSIKELNKQPRNELQREISIHQTRYICSYCKGSGHNARSCELKKKGVRAGTR